MSLKVDRVQLEIEIKNDSSRKRLRELEGQIGDMRKGLKKMKESSPEYDKQLQALKPLIKEYDSLISKIGITNLSTNELRKRQKDLNAILRNMPPTHENYGAYKDEVTKVNARLKELNGTSKRVNDSLSKFGTSFQVFAGNMMTKGISKLGEWVNKGKEFVSGGIDIADKAEGIVKAFNKLNAPDLLKDLRKETKGLVSDFQLMQHSVLASNFSIPLNNMGSLLRFAQQRAQETGESVDYLVDSIVKGIGRKSPLILDNLGLSAARLQAQAKKTGDFTAAAIQIVNEELEKQGVLSATSADIEVQKNVKWENAQLKLGRRFQWLGALYAEVSGNMADSISAVAGDTSALSDKYQDQIEKVAHLETNTLGLTERYMELKEKGSLTKDEHVELNKIMTIISNTVPGVISQFDEYGNVLSINTDKVYEYIAAEKSKLAILNKDAIEERTKELKIHRIQLSLLQDQLSRNVAINYISTGRGKMEKQEREMSEKEYLVKKKEYDALVELERGTQAILNDLTGASVEDRVKRQKGENEARVRFNEMNKKSLDAWIKDESNAKDEYLAIAKSVYDQRFGTGNGSVGDKSAEQRTKLNNAIKQLETSHLEELAALQKKYLAEGFESEFDYNQAILKQQYEFDDKKKAKLLEFSKSITDPSIRIDILKQISDIDKKILDRQVDQANKIKKIILDSDPLEAEKEAHRNRLREVGLFGKEREELTESQLNALDSLTQQHADNIQKLSSKSAMVALKQLDEAQSLEVTKLEERRVSEKMSEQQYRAELLKIEIDFLNKRLLVNGVSGAKIAEINKQINNAKADGIADKDKARESVLKEFDLKSLKDKKQSELEVIKYYEREGIISHDEALKIKKQLDDEYFAASVEKYAKVNEAVQQIGGNTTGAMNNFQSAEESAIARKYDKQIKAAEGNAKLQQKLEKEKEEELNKTRAEYADKQFAVQAAMIVSETAMAAMRAYSAMAGIPIVGPALGAVAAAAAVVYGGSQLRVAEEQRNAAKEGYQVGGFTPRDPRDDTAVGTVHANEFVANANATRNPSVRKFLDVFDMAQKNGTIHMLNTTQILEKVRYETNNGYMSGGYTPPSSGGSVDTSLLMTLIESNTQVMTRMADRLDEGIVARSVVSGDNGSYKQTQRYESLLRNARRQNV